MNEKIERARQLTRGCVVMMKRESGLIGYGNAQCVSWVSHEIGEMSLYGHNENYRTYDVEKVLEYPLVERASSSAVLDDAATKEKAASEPVYDAYCRFVPNESNDGYTIETCSPDDHGAFLARITRAAHE